jgi:hypothetical protein
MADRPAVGKTFDQFDLDRRRNDLRLVLQAIARPDFDQFDPLPAASSHCVLRKSTSSAPSAT